MKKIILIIMLALINTIGVYAQEYIVFERQRSISFKPLRSGITLAQNEVNLKQQNTTLSIFNFYYTSDSVRLYHLNSKSLSVKPEDLKVLTNDVVLAAVPLINPGEQLGLKKITLSELRKLNVISTEELLNRNIPKLFVHSTLYNFKMPALKTLQYGLIIKENEEYFKVTQPMVSLTYLICNDDWYFPNEFKDGVISTGSQFIKTYNMTDFQKIQQETNNSKAVNKQLTDRTYLANIDKSNSFGINLYNYWEFLNGDAVSIYQKPKSLQQYHPGFGSFSFLPKIGVVNCTMDYYLKGKILYNQKPSFEITAVNGLNPEMVGKLVKARNGSVIIPTE